MISCRALRRFCAIFSTLDLVNVKQMHAAEAERPRIVERKIYDVNPSRKLGVLSAEKAPKVAENNQKWPPPCYGGKQIIFGKNN